MHYYTDPPGSQDTGQRGQIVLYGRPPTRLNDSLNIYGFEIPGHSVKSKKVEEDTRTKALCLYAETEEEMADWVEQLIFCSLRVETRTALKMARDCFGVMKQQFERKKWPPAVLAEVEPCITPGSEVGLKGSVTKRPLKQSLATKDDDCRKQSSRKYEIQVTEIYRKYDPSKLDNPTFVPRVLERYAGTELELIQKLKEIYTKGKSEMDVNRLHLLVGIVTPLPAPWAGKLLLCQCVSDADWSALGPSCRAIGLEQYHVDLDEKVVMLCDEVLDYLDDAKESQNIASEQGRNNAQLRTLRPLVVEAIMGIAFPLSAEATCCEAYFDVDLEKYADLKWAKLESAYQILVRLIDDQDPSEEEGFLTEKLVNMLVNQFRTLDFREREAVHACLLQIFLAHKRLRAYMISCVNNFLLEATFLSLHTVGIGSVLGLLTDCVCEADEDDSGSATDDLLLTLCPTLLALHRPTFALEYHEQLTALLPHFVAMDPDYDYPDSFRVKVIRMLLKHWPRSDSDREEAFLEELEGLLGEMPEIQHEEVGAGVVERVFKTLEGGCFCNIHKSLEMLQLAEVQMLLEQEGMMQAAKKKITAIANQFVQYEDWDDLNIGETALATLELYAHVEDLEEEEEEAEEDLEEASAATTEAAIKQGEKMGVVGDNEDEKGWVNVVEEEVVEGEEEGDSDIEELEEGDSVPAMFTMSGEGGVSLRKAQTLQRMTLVRTNTADRPMSTFTMDGGVSLRKARTLQRTTTAERARALSEAERPNDGGLPLPRARGFSTQRVRGLSEAERPSDGGLPLPRTRGFSTAERARGMSQAERPVRGSLAGGLVKTHSRGLGRASVALRQVRCVPLNVLAYMLRNMLILIYINNMRVCHVRCVAERRL
jgi:hypothetical protein